ncbi:collagen-like protein [Maritalea sp.]|jgi:hypothetical protein|uniref:collagen-like triple helix repeat-containing protein n=1 Tax=Maritalea sp. TaxID=2003361 RepID=UPI0039E54287
MAEIYSAGTVDAVNGSKTLVLDGGAWTNLVVRSGDMVVVAGDHINFVETVTDTTNLEMAIAFDGTTASDLDYAILHGSYEWGLHRTQNELVAQYIQGLENPVRILTGSGAPDNGDGDDNGLYIDTGNGNMYLKTDGVWGLELNLKGPQGDQGDVGDVGPQGDPGADGSDGLNGADGNDGADGADGADGLNGLLSAAQTVKTADYTIVFGDKGKTLIANKATAISFDFATAAILTSDFMLIVKNEGVGTLTLDPNGAETIDGASSLDLAQGNSLIIYSDGTNLRTALAGGVATGVAAYDALVTKGANIASATTTDLSTATGDFVDVTGTTTITGLGTADAGVTRTVRFTGILTLTYNATSLILYSGKDITTYNGLVMEFRSLGSGNWVEVSQTPAYFTFTPAPSFGGGSVGLAGTFTGFGRKLGNFVTLWARCILTSKGSSTGSFAFGGFGEIASPDLAYWAGSSTKLSNFVSLVAGANVYMTGGENVVRLEAPTTAGSTDLTHVNFSDTTEFSIEISYRV